jgi:hypothetical protein
LAKERNLPIDHKWNDQTQFGAAAKPHVFVDGEYVEVPYVHQEFPKMMYHADFVVHPLPGQDLGFTQIAQVVENEEEVKELGPEWKASLLEHGIETCPSAETLQSRKRSQAAAGANWRAALPNSNPNITDLHLQFLQAAGVEVKTLGDVYTFLAGMTSSQMKSFMQEAAEWEKKQSGQAAKAAKK